MIELRLDDGTYMILDTNHEDYSMDVYLHKHGQIVPKSLKRNVKYVSELLDYIREKETP